MNNSNKYVLKDFVAVKTIIKALPEMAYVFNNNGEMVMWNKNVEEVLGYSKKELYLKSIRDFQDAPDKERVYKKFTEVFTKGTEQTVEYNLLTRSGGKIPCLGSGSRVFVDNKPYLIGIAINISKQKEAEKKVVSHLSELNKLKDQLQAENIYLRDEIKSHHDFHNIVGESEKLLENLYLIKQIAPTNTPVLLIGEHGTRKEIYARAIHDKSERAKKSFIKINCATLRKMSEESEKRLLKNIEIAENGTLFLDDLTEMNLELQEILLKIITGKNKLNLTK